jgi:hypothetical protein
VHHMTELVPAGCPYATQDVLAKRLLEDGAEAAAADDDSAAASRGGVGRAADGKSYQEEQEELRAAFLGATGSDGQEDSDEEGEFMRKKSKTEEEVCARSFCAPSECGCGQVEAAGRVHRRQHSHDCSRRLSHALAL